MKRRVNKWKKREIWRKRRRENQENHVKITGKESGLKKIIVLKREEFNERREK